MKWTAKTISGNQRMTTEKESEGGRKVKDVLFKTAKKSIKSNQTKARHECPPEFTYFKKQHNSQSAFPLNVSTDTAMASKHVCHRLACNQTGLVQLKALAKT